MNIRRAGSDLISGGNGLCRAPDWTVDVQCSKEQSALLAHNIESALASAASASASEWREVQTGSTQVATSVSADKATGR